MMLSANNAWRERNPRPTMNFIQKNWKGILVCLVMAVPCWLLGQRFPIVGGPVFGILAGMIVTLLWHDKSAAQPGISFVSKKVLQYAVILLGFGMNLSVIWQTGKQSLPIILVTITTSLVVSWLLHKLLHIPGKISTLVGVGSSICGGSAVAATASVIDADDEEVAQAISVIFFFNMLAAIFFPRSARCSASRPRTARRSASSPVRPSTTRRPSRLRPPRGTRSTGSAARRSTRP